MKEKTPGDEEMRREKSRVSFFLTVCDLGFIYAIN